MKGRDDLHVLVRRVQNGDSGAFDELYTHIFTPIYRYVYFRVKRKQDAEDIAQTVFLRAYQSLPRFEDKGVNPNYSIEPNQGFIFEVWFETSDPSRNFTFEITDKVSQEKLLEFRLIPKEE